MYRSFWHGRLPRQVLSFMHATIPYTAHSQLSAACSWQGRGRRWQNTALTSSVQEPAIAQRVIYTVVQRYIAATTGSHYGPPWGQMSAGLCLRCCLRCCRLTGRAQSVLSWAATQLVPPFTGPATAGLETVRGEWHTGCAMEIGAVIYYERARSAKRVSTDYERGRRPSEFY